MAPDTTLNLRDTSQLLDTVLLDVSVSRGPGGPFFRGVVRGGEGNTSSRHTMSGVIPGTIGKRRHRPFDDRGVLHRKRILCNQKSSEKGPDHRCSPFVLFNFWVLWKDYSGLTTETTTLDVFPTRAFPGIFCLKKKNT